MGCADADPACRASAQPRHTVTITRLFSMMTTEVTVTQFRRYADATGSRMPRQPGWNERDHPVVNVMWGELRDFCRWVGGRLPTEAEWEYAARAGHHYTYPWGDQFYPAPGVLAGGGANAIMRVGRDIWRETAPVGSFPPNGYGLYDMTGNVWEWVHDWYWARAYAASPAEDPRGAAEGTERVLRGGGWDNHPANLRVSLRLSRSPTGRHNLYYGGRCARDF